MDCFNRIWRRAVCVLQLVLLTCQPFNAIILEIYPSFKAVIQEGVHDSPHKVCKVFAECEARVVDAC